jgi:hypothetical protein
MSDIARVRAWRQRLKEAGLVQVALPPAVPAPDTTRTPATPARRARHAT